MILNFIDIIFINNLWLKLEVKYGIWENGYRKKFIENNLALKTYGKWIDNRYNRFFFAPKQNILDFLDAILNINN